LRSTAEADVATVMRVIEDAREQEAERQQRDVAAREPE